MLADPNDFQPMFDMLRSARELAALGVDKGSCLKIRLARFTLDAVCVGEDPAAPGFAWWSVTVVAIVDDYSVQANGDTLTEAISAARTGVSESLRQHPAYIVAERAARGAVS